MAGGTRREWADDPIAPDPSRGRSWKHPTKEEPVVRTEHRKPIRLTRRTKWTLLAVAAALVAAGGLLPDALPLAAGLILAGSVGVGDGAR